MTKQLNEALETAEYVCQDCGIKYGTETEGIETYHLGECDVCKKSRQLCHVRRYNYLRKIKKVLDKPQN